MKKREVIPEEVPVNEEREKTEFVPETIPEIKTDAIPELKPGEQADIFGTIKEKLSNNNEIKESNTRKKMTPEERAERKKQRENDKLKEEQEKDESLEMFFSPVLGEMFLNLYIIKVCKCEDNPAKEQEITAFTDSVKGIAKKYMTDAMKNNIELLNFAMVMTSVTLSRVDISKVVNKIKGIEEPEV